MPDIVEISPEKIEEARSTSLRIAALLPECDKAESCGIDMGAIRSEMLALKERLDAIIQIYGHTR